MKPDRTPPVLLNAFQLRCERDERLLFDGLSFSLQAGESLRIEGPNGAGKTTLIRILARLGGLWEGELEYGDGASLFVGHEAGVKLALTAAENLRWLCGLHGGSSPQQRLAALASMGLRGFEDQPCSSLSAGQRRRVALARLLLIPARTWVLDEPYTALDVEGCALLTAMLNRHLDGGGALIFSSHQEIDGLRQHAAVRLAGAETRYVRIDT